MLTHPFVKEGEKVQVIWLDNHYLLLRFYSPETCERVMNAWKNRENNKDNELKMLTQLTMKPYDAYEELCGVDSCQKKHEELKRSRDDSQVLFETKRIRVIKLENNSRQMCVVMYIVCTNH